MHNQNKLLRLPHDKLREKMAKEKRPAICSRVAKNSHRIGFLFPGIIGFPSWEAASLYFLCQTTRLFSEERRPFATLFHGRMDGGNAREEGNVNYRFSGKA